MRTIPVNLPDGGVSMCCPALPAGKTKCAFFFAGMRMAFLRRKFARSMGESDERTPMTSFPHSPRLLKGAIVGVDIFNPLASVILFQYNPETLTRSLTARTPERPPGERVDRSEAMRLTGPPEETIQLEIEIDAADQLEQAEDTATTMGVHPALASLEMLLYPKSLAIIANHALLRAGIKEVAAPKAPLTLFVWG